MFAIDRYTAIYVVSQVILHWWGSFLSRFALVVDSLAHFTTLACRSERGVVSPRVVLSWVVLAAALPLLSALPEPLRLVYLPALSA